MGTASGGAWGEFKGKIGNLVASPRKGKTVLRTLPAKSNRPASAAQIVQRRKFKLAVGYLNPMAAVLHYTFRDGSSATGLNLATADTLANAIVGEGESITINYSRVRIARGSLPLPTSASAVNEGTNVIFEWNPDTEIGIAADTDKAILVLNCPASGHSIFKMNTAMRKDGRAVVNAKLFANKEVHLYLAFMSTNRSKCSDSLFLGSITLPAAAV